MTAGGPRRQALILVGNSQAGCASETPRPQAVAPPQVLQGGHAVSHRSAKNRLTPG